MAMEGNAKRLPRRLRRFVCAALVLTVCTWPGATALSADDSVAAPDTSTAGANDGSSAIERALLSRGSITFRKTSLQEVVFLLSDLWQINIVAGDKITGEVSGVFNDAPLKDVLSAILTSSGYGYTSAGNSLIVLPIDQVGTTSPDFRSRTLPLRIVDETQRASTIEAAKMLLSERGKIQSFGSGSVLVIDSPDRISQVERMFLEMQSTAPTAGNAIATPSGDAAEAAPSGWSEQRIAYFTPQFTEAIEMGVPLAAALGTEINNILTEGDGPMIAVYEQENRIMVKGTPEQLRMASEVFQQLDMPRAQVRITAMIYDVKLNEKQELGINWSRGFRQSVTGDGPLSNFTGNLDDAVGFGTGGVAGASTFTLQTLSNNFDAQMILQALDATIEAKLLANPSITVSDRRPASIKIVQQIPIVTVSPQNQAGPVLNQVTFKDAGIILNVTPRISNDNTIELKVQPEYSVKVGEIDRNPVIDSRTAETTVRVQDGQMFVLGGLRQKQINEVVGGVPWLKDVKYVGRLFQHHSTEVVESELIVFLKPELVCPTYPGYAREQQAERIASLQLDAIPYATICPQSPTCCDPACPNHHPRARINGGSLELEMLGGVGVTPFVVYSSDNVMRSDAMPWQPGEMEVTTDTYSPVTHSPVYFAPYEILPAPTPLGPQ